MTARREKILTLGLFILARGPPADARLVFVQIEEPHQSLGATAELHHLGPHLHGAHAFLHWRQEYKPDRRRKKGWKVVKRETTGVCYPVSKKITVCDRQKCAYTSCFHSTDFKCVCVVPQNFIWALMKNTVIYTHKNTHRCKANALDMPVTANRDLLVLWEEEKGREDRRQWEAISLPKSL